MLNKEEAGKQIVEAVWMNKKHNDVFFDELEKKISLLNAKTTKETVGLYDRIIHSLDTKNDSIDSSIANFAKVQKLMTGITKIQSGYRKKYSRLFVDAKQDSFDLVKNRENKITALLNKAGILENSRTKITEESKGLLKILDKQAYKKINQTLDKWKNFAYDTFYSGISRGINIFKLKDLLLTDTGTIKIGSSLTEESERELLISTVENRTAFLRQRAKEMGYKYCWNSNPMDRRTKPECISASLAGTIPEDQMGAVHGFPPRFICRCELVYTRGEWTAINKGVNKAIETRKLQLLEELKSAPKQKAKWRNANGTIIKVDPIKDPVRAAGLKEYKEIEDKIDLVENSQVPEFESIDLDGTHIEDKL